MKQRKPSYLNLLNMTLRENPVWHDLAVAVSKVINEVVHEQRWALSRVREPHVIQRGDWVDTPLGQGQVTVRRRKRTDVDANANTYQFQDYMDIQVPGQGFITLPVQSLHSRRVLIEGARFSGFDYFSDFLQDDDYERIHKYIGMYWNNSGGDNFAKFLGFIKRTRFSMEQLWTEELGHPGDPSLGTDPANSLDHYETLETLVNGSEAIWSAVNFAMVAGNDPGYAGYTYPTSHVQLSYDILEHPELDIVGVVSLFYYLAPIHLVLERFAATVYSTETVYVGRAAQVSTINEYTDLWDKTLALNYHIGRTAQDAHTLQYSDRLDPALILP